MEWRWDLKNLVRKDYRRRAQQWISSTSDKRKAQEVRSWTFHRARRRESTGTIEWLSRLHRSHTVKSARHRRRNAGARDRDHGSSTPQSIHRRIPAQTPGSTWSSKRSARHGWRRRCRPANGKASRAVRIGRVAAQPIEGPSSAPRPRETTIAVTTRWPGSLRMVGRQPMVLPAARAFASELVRQLPATPQSPLFTSSRTTSV